VYRPASQWYLQGCRPYQRLCVAVNIRN